MLWLCKGNPVAFVVTSKVLNRLNGKRKEGKKKNKTHPMKQRSTSEFVAVLDFKKLSLPWFSCKTEMEN